MFNLSQREREIKKINTSMLEKLILDYNEANGENSFHRTSLRWRRIMVESADSSKTYQECVKKVKSQISDIKLGSLGSFS